MYKKNLIVFAIVMAGFLNVKSVLADQTYTCNCYFATPITATTQLIANNGQIVSTAPTTTEYACNYACKASNVPPAGEAVYYTFGSNGYTRVGTSNGTCAAVTDCKTAENPVCNTVTGICVNQAQASSAAMAGQINNTPAATTPVTTGVTPNLSGATVSGTLGASGGIITCGRDGQKMCTLCDLIAGLNNIIGYIEKIAVGVGLLAITIAGVMYIVSGGDQGLIGKAKTTMKNALIGFVIVFAGWVIINTAIMGLGSAKTTDANGNITSMFGITMTGWGQFDCTANPNR